MTCKLTSNSNSSNITYYQSQQFKEDKCQLKDGEKLERRRLDEMSKMQGTSLLKLQQSLE